MFTYAANTIIGVDEVGRGSVAGNVVACACILPIGFTFAKLTDSKKVSKKVREQFFEYAQANGAIFAIGSANVREIETLNIRMATMKAMNDAIRTLVDSHSFVNPATMLVKVDGNDFVTTANWNVQTIIGGDALVKEISAASCYAKAYRDHQMHAESAKYDHRYGWDTNNGYGTLFHKNAIIKHGMSPYHRPSFVKTLLSK